MHEGGDLMDFANTYSIVRFYADPHKDELVIQTGLSLDQAQEHCLREDTHDPEAGWFDGFRQE